MRVLMVTYNDDGDIAFAAVHDIVNAGTYGADGYLAYPDGLTRPIPASLLVLEAEQPLTGDVLAWPDKYYVEGDVLYEDSEWQEPEEEPHA